MLHVIALEFGKLGFKLDEIGLKLSNVLSCLFLVSSCLVNELIKLTFKQSRFCLSLLSSERSGLHLMTEWDLGLIRMSRSSE